MLQRTEHANGLITFQSPLLRELGVCHAFTTRHGGTSTGPYASLNLGSLAKDDDTDFNLAVAENFRRLRATLNVPRTVRVDVRQVHGCDVWVASEHPKRPADAPCADAIVTDKPGKLLTIRTADCVPVLIADRQGRAVAAIHAGWRGIVAEIVPQTIQTLKQQYAISPDQLVAAIGPHISVDHYEVGPEVTVEFDDVDLGDAVVRENGTRPHIDMGLAVQLQLTRAGIPAEAIDTTDCCTYRDADDFYSYRRDGEQTGRMAAVILLPQS